MNITALTEAKRALDNVCADQETAIQMLEDAIEMLRSQQEHDVFGYCSDSNIFGHRTSA